MEVRSLTADLVDDYFTLFDSAFADNPAWAGCYCEYYEVPGPDEDFDTDEPESRERHRTTRRERILAGTVHGLLAYEGDEPIGWLNCGPRAGYRNLRSYADIPSPHDPPTGSVQCFVVHPDHRGKGVASALLAAADDHLRALGMHVAEGYPRSIPVREGQSPTAAYYKGSREMFEQAGYEHVGSGVAFHVMRKDLLARPGADR